MAMSTEKEHERKGIASFPSDAMEQKYIDPRTAEQAQINK